MTNTKLKYPRKVATNRRIIQSDQLWEIDIKYVYIAGENRFLYLMEIIDVYDRMITDYYIGLCCDGHHASQLLKRALWKRKLTFKDNRPVIRTDNGPQFISKAFESACDSCQVEHERIPPKTPNKNAHIESFHALLERECLTRYELSSYQQAYGIISNYIDFYNNRRFHGSLYDLAPARFRDMIAQKEIEGIIVNV